MGRLYRQTRRYQEAEPLLLGSCECLAQAFDASQPDVVRASSQLAMLYDAWGKPEKAAEWRKKLPPDPQK